MTSSESEGQQPPRKRSRTNTDDNGTKKARGRPRVDTQDATAADRRRTQIRLAQRAYRQRKETTISSLKQQNNHLHKIIEEMNRSFLRFNDTVVRSALLHQSPDIARELKDLTENFVNLAKSANEGAEEDDSLEPELDSATMLHHAATAARASQDAKSIEPQHTDIGWGYTASLATASDTTHDQTYKRTTYTEPLGNAPLEAPNLNDNAAVSLIRARSGGLTIGQILDQSRNQTNASPDSQSLPFGLMDILMRDHDTQSAWRPNPNIFSATIPSPELTPPIARLPTPPMLSSLMAKSAASPVWTYSFQETTFARRLTRAALEKGFRLLSEASIRPAALNYIFRLTLPYSSIEQLRERFKVILSRGIDEELDCWQTPFIHLGGAGTHYPRKDAQGKPIKLPNSWNIRSIGPQKALRVTNTTDPSQSHDLTVDLTGFDGEWFDAYDVQGYLEAEKGCYINPQETFAEVLVDVDDDSIGSLVHSRNLDINLDISQSQNGSHSSQVPPLSHRSDSTGSLSSAQTTPGRGNTNQIDTQFQPNSPAERSESPFGLDMAGVFNDFSKMNNFDASSLFDQPLGLDLAPHFDMSQSNQNPFGDLSNLGLDLMPEPMPVVKQKQKKAAYLDISKLVEEIVKHGVCLGRAPGFRRRDIDMAFNASLINVF